MKVILVVHGGAGNIPDSRVVPKLNVMVESIRAGIIAMRDSNSAICASTAAVAVMEDDEAFNAGYGSVLTQSGLVQMDAAVMDGDSLNIGGVAAIERVKNPIFVAQRVLEVSPHCLLAGSGAQKFAQQHGFELVEPEALISPSAKIALSTVKASKIRHQAISNETGQSQVESKRDTVGALAMDIRGNLAAATSTGGMTGKADGRVGDSPIVGAGFYAENKLGAVCTTGVGECLLKHLVAFRIAQKLDSSDPQKDVIRSSLNEMSARVGGDGGAIAIDCEGNISIDWNSRRMGWAYAMVEEDLDKCSRILVHFGCNRGDDYQKEISII